MMSRQNLYKTYLHCDEEKLLRKDRVRDQVISMLDERPGLYGTQVRKELAARGIVIGRDSLYQIVNRYKLTLNSRKKAWWSFLILPDFHLSTLSTFSTFSTFQLHSISTLQCLGGRATV